MVDQILMIIRSIIKMVSAESSRYDTESSWTIFFKYFPPIGLPNGGLFSVSYAKAQEKANILAENVYIKIVIKQIFLVM